MRQKRKVLIISGEAWRNESSGGNVLSNLFRSFTNDYEFAQIYCNPQPPLNDICAKYFHLSELEMVKACLHKRPFGHELSKEELTQAREGLSVNDSTAFTLVKKLHLNIFYTIQDCLWRYSNWRTADLKKFILDFNPDLIFAPMYYGLNLHRLDRYVAELTGKKVISYVSDDHLTLKQFSLSPVFWFNRLLLRKNVIATAKYYSLLYTMTQEQLSEYQGILKVPMKILKKTADFDSPPIIKEISGTPIKLIYGGNLANKRYRTLYKLVRILKEINQNEVKVVLYTYTQSPLTHKLKRLLHDGRNSFLMGKVTMGMLKEKYADSDIVLHVESLKLKQRLLTRLSFSTKIIDLFHSARCIMAICWEGSSPYKYLKLQDAAVCVSNPAQLKENLLMLIENPIRINEYAQKAWDCGRRNHNASQILSNLKQDFDRLSSN